MYQPSKWWLGLIPLALLWAIANLATIDWIEADLSARVKTALAGLSQSAIQKADIVVAGRDVKLSGTALSPQAAQQAEATADAVFGVRKVISEMTVAQAVKPAPPPPAPRPLAAVPPQPPPPPPPVVAPPPPAPPPQVVQAPEPPKPQPPAPPVAAGCTIDQALAQRPVRFRTGSARISDESGAVLKDIATAAKRCASASVAIAGHADSTGSKKFNVTLSNARAKAVADYLVKNGIDKSRITTAGYGESRPAATNDTKAGRAQNRRAEFSFASSGR